MDKTPDVLAGLVEEPLFGPRVAPLCALESLNETYSQDLAALLSHDESLAHAIASSLTVITGEQILKETAAWCERFRADTYAIVLNGQAVGVVSLSHQDQTQGTARVGIWIGSHFWGQGVASAIAPLLVAKAKAKGFRRLLAQIALDNKRSQAIWRKFGGHLTQDGPMLGAVMDLV